MKELDWMEKRRNERKVRKRQGMKGSDSKEMKGDHSHFMKKKKTIGGGEGERKNCPYMKEETEINKEREWKEDANRKMIIGIITTVKKS